VQVEPANGAGGNCSTAGVTERKRRSRAEQDPIVQRMKEKFEPKFGL